MEWEGRNRLTVRTGIRSMRRIFGSLLTGGGAARRVSESGRVGTGRKGALSPRPSDLHLNRSDASTAEKFAHRLTSRVIKDAQTDLRIGASPVSPSGPGTTAKPTEKWCGKENRRTAMRIERRSLSDFEIEHWNAITASRVLSTTTSSLPRMANAPSVSRNAGLKTTSLLTTTIKLEPFVACSVATATTDSEGSLTTRNGSEQLPNIWSGLPAKSTGVLR